MEAFGAGYGGNAVDVDAVGYEEDALDGGVREGEAGCWVGGGHGEGEVLLEVCGFG